MKKRVQEILPEFEGKKGELIPMLQRIQEDIGYISIDSMKITAKYLKLPESHVFGVASFYSQFRFTPVGKNMIMVCKGTACHVKGAEKILDEISRNIGIKDGETSSDMQYTLVGVACIGCCALAPCITVNNEVHGRLNTKLVDKIFKRKKSEGKSNE